MVPHVRLSFQEVSSFVFRVVHEADSFMCIFRSLLHTHKKGMIIRVSMELVMHME